ncbi:MAG: ACP S-malonyltransferase, partial [Candidatus Dadabacteria bacterium]
QGAQKAGMLDAWLGLPSVRESVRLAEDLLSAPLGTWMREGPDETLRETAWAQPALLALGVPIARELIERGLPVVAAAGHSLGELTALTAAGVFTLEQGIRLAHERGRAMQEAVPIGQGGMAALLGVDDAALATVLERAHRFGVIVAANENAPGHTVVSGEAAALAAVREHASDCGIRRVVPLPVSAPFHSPLMAPAAERLRSLLAETPLAEPAFPVWSNVHCAPYQDVGQIRDALVEQITAPVRWTTQVSRMYERLSDSIAVDVAPAGVLSGLHRRIRADWPIQRLQSPADLDVIAERAA